MTDLTPPSPPEPPRPDSPRRPWVRRTIIGFLVVVIFGLIVLFVALSMKAALGLNAFTITGAILCALLFIVLAIVFALIQKFTMDFVVPTMFLRTTSCVTAWREFLALLSANKARFALYILFQIVIAIAIEGLRKFFVIGQEPVGDMA